MPAPTLPISDTDIQKAREYLAVLKEIISLEKAAGVNDLPPRYSAEQVAAMYGRHHYTVTNWIKKGKLGAINLADGDNGRTTYLIRPEDLEAFEARHHTLLSGKKVTA